MASKIEPNPPYREFNDDFIAWLQEQFETILEELTIALAGGDSGGDTSIEIDGGGP